MAFRRKNIEIDPLEELGSDLSDISDVKPEDLDKILKRADDLDNEIFAKISPKASASEVRGASRTKDFHTPMPIEESTPKPTRNEAEEEIQPYRNRNRGSGDWLGLKDNQDNPKDDLFKNSLFSDNPDFKEKPPTRSKTADNLLNKKETPLPAKPATARKRVNILDDLFGDSLLKGDKKTEKSNTLDTNEKNTDDTKYMPSLSTARKIEKRREAPSGLEFDAEIDWVLGPKPKSTPEFHKPEVQVQQVQKVQTFKDVPKRKSTNETDNSILLNESSTQNTGQKIKKFPPEVPEWLGGQKESLPVFNLNQENPIQEQKSSLQDTQEVENVVGQLSTIQIQLGAAMTRHNQNLQNCMQVLVNEARRMSFAEHLINPINPGKTIPVTEIESRDEITEKKDDESKKNIQEPISKKEDEYQETIKYQEDRIHDLEVKITRLDIQIEQLNMKIENNETMKNLELENLKQTYELELESIQKRSERNKITYDEIIEELEKKILKMKKAEEEIEKEYREKMEALQADRIQELDKIKEYHKISLDHALSSVQPNIIRDNNIKQPLKPMDEIELSERESTLIEKEKQIEILKASLVAQKQQLDEAIEKEKVMREERERECRRVLLEVKYKEELHLKDIERKKEQLDLQEKQITQMRTEALEEQTELAKQKLMLAAEKARMEAAMKIERPEGDTNMQQMDLMKAKFEMEAALTAVKEAREAADDERRRNAEMRKISEEITWEQKNKDQQLEMRERHIMNLMKDAEVTKEEGIQYFKRAEMMKKELEDKNKELRAVMIDIEFKEKGLAKERLEIARERLDLERQKSNIEAFLPTLQPSEELRIAPVKIDDDKGYVDPKVLIMRLRAEKDLGSFMLPQNI